MNTGCFKCDKAQWDADGCTCEITGLLVGNAERGCEYRKDIELKPCPFCGGKATNCTKQYDGRIYGYRIQCDNAGCSCRTPWLCYQEDAADVWNRRDGVDEKKLSCHFEHCKDCLSLIKHRIPDTEVAFEIRCGRKHKGIILKGERLLSFGDITPEDFDKAEGTENE